MMVDPCQRCNVMVDGKDFRIQELAPFDPKWYRHKFDRPGLHYEIVWVNRPFPAREWPDWKITRLTINHQLHDHKGYVGDTGYYDG